MHLRHQNKCNPLGHREDERKEQGHSPGSKRRGKNANEAEKGAGEKLGESEIPEAKEKGVINCEKWCFAPGKLGTEHSDIFLVK